MLRHAARFFFFRLCKRHFSPPPNSAHGQVSKPLLRRKERRAIAPQFYAIMVTCGRRATPLTIGSPRARNSGFAKDRICRGFGRLPCDNCVAATGDLRFKRSNARDELVFRHAREICAQYDLGRFLFRKQLIKVDGHRGRSVLFLLGKNSSAHIPMRHHLRGANPASGGSRIHAIKTGYKLGFSAQKVDDPVGASRAGHHARDHH